MLAFHRYLYVKENLKKGIFNFGKKKEKEVECACNAMSGQLAEHNNCCCDSRPKDVNIKVLGSGYKACHELYENVKEAVNHTGIQAEVEYVTDLEKIMRYGAMSMPCIVVNETVVSMGKVLKVADVEQLLHKLGF